MTRSLRLPLLACLALALLALSACTKASQPPLPVGSLKLGLAYFTQPAEPSDMLAGYTVEDLPRVDEKHLSDLDALLASVLSSESKNDFRSRESASHCSKTVLEQQGRSNNQAALRTWSSIGRCMGVDLLVVPQIYEFRERDGGSFGVITPARVVMDIFVLDVRNETLISRSRFDETQAALTSNLLEADKFFKRKGQWISARDLAKEGMVKAVKDLGL
ncbi:hypothetical protein LJB81_04055 [Desulfovibrio sp. OttesenSCG-928-M14]|nr:hypothetical protein [Desulfovibrio sp. OttesenSCG-928-M14]MDL2290848.1 hypothetical protein [Desulfovibrio sp. OttesenSCG-928-F20]